MVDFNPAADFVAVVDGLQPLTLVSRYTGQQQSITHGLGRAVSVKEAIESDGFYKQSDRVYHFPVSEVLEAPRLGDCILDETGDVWVLIGLGTETLRSRYRAITRNMVIVHRLDTLVTIQEASYTKGVGGAQEATWATIAPNVRARIQPLPAGEKSDDGTQSLDHLVRIFLQEPYQLRRHHRIIGSDGTIYRVMGFSAAAAIDQLMSVDAEPAGVLTPWPEGA